jgi:hypothetical protein
MIPAASRPGQRDRGGAARHSRLPPLPSRPSPPPRRPQQAAAQHSLAPAGLPATACPLAGRRPAALPADGGLAARGTRSGSGTSHPISFITGPAATVDLRAAPGQVTIVGSATGVVTLTGKMQWTGRAPIATARLDRIAGVLRLSYRCAAVSPCTGNYRLVVPWRTAIALREPSGHVVISGLDGPLRITARHVDISATGLRSPSLRAAIASGHMSASFASAPRHVAVALTSAQATLRLPTSAAYAISEQVTAGYVHAGIPQHASAAHSIEVRIDSGELELLPR